MSSAIANGAVRINRSRNARRGRGERPGYHAWAKAGSSGLNRQAVTLVHFALGRNCWHWGATVRYMSAQARVQTLATDAGEDSLPAANWWHADRSS